MPSTYKTLGQSNPAAATLTAAYTVPAATQAIVGNITITNRSAVATSYRLSVAVAGAADNNIQYIAFDVPIAGNETKGYDRPIGMQTTDVIRVYALLATLTFNINGVELT